LAELRGDAKTRSEDAAVPAVEGRAWTGIRNSRVRNSRVEDPRIHHRRVGRFARIDGPGVDRDGGIGKTGPSVDDFGTAIDTGRADATRHQPQRTADEEHSHGGAA
jgi:hypothetical protein